MYLSYFGFKDEPFRLTPDPRYLHLSEPHQAALTSLLEGIFYRKGLVMLTGPIGTGKTTLLHAALQIISDRKMPIRSALVFNPLLTRDEFLELMLHEFEVRCSSSTKPGRLAALHQMLLDTQQRGGSAVLFVDEAHLLSAELLEEIRLLGNADAHKAKLLQIVLSGQPELLTVMERKDLSALQQRIAARANLRPLTLLETRAYVAERLYAGGLQGSSPFPSNTLEALHNFSGGVPRLINLIGDGCLALGFRTEQRTIQPEMVQEVAARLNLLRPSVPASARNVVREPVWQKPAAQPRPINAGVASISARAAAIVEDQRTLVARAAQGGMSQEGSTGEFMDERVSSQSVVVIEKPPSLDPSKDRAATQKTAVDRLIDAMKQTRHAARGVH